MIIILWLHPEDLKNLNTTRGIFSSAYILFTAI